MVTALGGTPGDQASRTLLAADMFGEEQVDEVIESGDVGRHASELLALMKLGLLD